MSRERQPFKRTEKGNVTINIRDIFRNEDICNEIIKKFKPKKNKYEN